MTEQVHHTTRRLHKELRPTHLLNAIKMMKAASPNWVDWVLNIRQSMGMESLSYDTLTHPDVIVAKTIFELKAKLKEINSEQQALNRLSKAVPSLRKDFPNAHITDLIENARKHCNAVVEASAAWRDMLSLLAELHRVSCGSMRLVNDILHNINPQRWYSIISVEVTKMLSIYDTREPEFRYNQIPEFNPRFLGANSTILPEDGTKGCGVHAIIFAGYESNGRPILFSTDGTFRYVKNKAGKKIIQFDMISGEPISPQWHIVCFQPSHPEFARPRKDQPA